MQQDFQRDSNKQYRSLCMLIIKDKLLIAELAIARKKLQWKKITPILINRALLEIAKGNNPFYILHKVL